MPQQLITYSVVKALYDRGLDYIDAFAPFLLEVLPRERKPVSVLELQDRLQNRFSLYVPQHALMTIARRAKRRGMLTLPQGRIAVTAAGTEYVDSLETEREVQRRTNALIEDAREYLAQRHNELVDGDRMRQLIEGVISRNLDFFAAYVDSANPGKIEAVDRSLTKLEILLVEYFQHIEATNSQRFNTLSDLVAGSVLAGALNAESFGDAGQKFGPTNVYIDTNFAFSVLDLTYEEVSGPARELLSLLRASERFHIFVFDFTIAEAIALLSNYETEYRSYVPGVKVNHIFSSLRTLGWEPSDVREFIADIDERLKARGISIVNTGIQLKSFVPDDKDAASALVKYKPEQGHIGQNHDLAAIQTVAKLRRHPVRKIQHARELFLTSDFRLARYAYCERGHQANGTISEVIPDQLLTNLVWLKSPDLLVNVRLDSFISMHSRELLIDRGVWRRFYQSVRSLQESGGLADRDVDLLLYDRHVLDALRVADASAPVDEAFVLNSLEIAQEAVGLELERRTQEAVSAARTELGDIHSAELEERARVVRERDEEIAKMLAGKEAEERERILRARKAVARVREKSSQTATRVINTGRWIVAVAIFTAILPIINYIVREWEMYESWLWGVGFGLSLIFTVVGVKLDFLRVWSRLRTKLENKIYERRLSEIEHLLPDPLNPHTLESERLTWTDSRTSVGD
jgi:hypothetical protein